MTDQVVAAHQFSSYVIGASAAKVFELVRPLTFKWMQTVAKADRDESTGAINIAYGDNTVQKIQELEFSNLDLKVSWEVVESDPPAPTSSAHHTIRCYRSTESPDECFVTWSTDFSSDVTLAVVEDCKWKKTDSFKQLQDFIGREPSSSGGYSGGGVSSPSPLSPHSYASKLIPAQVDAVFELVKPLTFKWMKTVASAQKEEGTGAMNIAYTDHSVQKLNIVELSLHDRIVSWEVVESDPPAETFSCVHTIACHKVTGTNETFITWNTNYSSDCTVAVLHDSKWKKTEAFDALIDFVKPV